MVIRATETLQAPDFIDDLGVKTEMLESAELTFLAGSLNRWLHTKNRNKPSNLDESQRQLEQRFGEIVRGIVGSADFSSADKASRLSSVYTHLFGQRLDCITEFFKYVPLENIGQNHVSLLTLEDTINGIFNSPLGLPVPGSVESRITNYRVRRLLNGVYSDELNKDAGSIVEAYNSRIRYRQKKWNSSYTELLGGAMVAAGAGGLMLTAFGLAKINSR